MKRSTQECSHLRKTSPFLSNYLFGRQYFSVFEIENDVAVAKELFTAGLLYFFEIKSCFDGLWRAAVIRMSESVTAQLFLCCCGNLSQMEAREEN